MVVRCVVIALAILVGISTINAEVIVNTSLTASLTITPGSLDGDSISLSILPGVFGEANATAQDSVSLLSPAFASNFNFDGPTSPTSATTTLAYASGASDGSALTAGGTSGVNMPNLNASALGEDGNGQLTGFFEIVDTTNTGTNPISVNFTANLSVNQNLFTNPYGISASSEVTFALQLDPSLTNLPTNFLYYDNSLSIGTSGMPIGSNMMLSTVSTPTVGDTATVNTNTPYYFFMESDAEASGEDSQTPEPGSLWLVAAAVAVIAAYRSRSYHSAP